MKREERQWEREERQWEREETQRMMDKNRLKAKGKEERGKKESLQCKERKPSAERYSINDL